MVPKDLFSKRQPGNPKGTRRQVQLRTPAPRVLLVCEGEKTEPKYFNELVGAWSLSPQVQVGKNDKGMDGVFALLESKLPAALKHAKTLAANPADNSEHPNPSTRMHELITRLQAVAASKRK